LLQNQKSDVAHLIDFVHSMVERLLRMWRTFGTRRRVVTWTFDDCSSEGATAAPGPALGLDRLERVAVLDRITRAIRRAGQRLEPSLTFARERVPVSWIFALAVLVVVYLATCGVPRLFDQIDGQYAGAAREMMVRGDWLTPTQNGVPRLQKPPLVYWCEILSMHVFGVNEFGARFPVALATFGWFLATGLLGQRVIGTRSAAFAAALTLAMFSGTFFFTHLVMPEPFLACFVTLSFWSLIGAANVRNEEIANVDGWLMAAWMFIALGTLAKGVHALLIPIVAMSGTAWLRPSIRVVWRRFLLRPQGWILFIAIVAPWYLMTEWRYPGFLRDHFFNEQIGSALSRRWPPDSDHVPLSMFWLEHLVLFFPITLLFPAAIRASFRAHEDRRPWLKEDGLLLLCWFLVDALGISFANIQDYYLMIAWPPVAVWISWAITRHSVSFKWPAIVIGLLGISGLTIGSFLAVWGLPDSGESSNSQLIIGDTILNVFQILPASVWGEIVPLLCLASTCAVVTGAFVLLCHRKGKSDLSLAGFALFMAAIFLVSTRGMAVVQDEFSSAKVAKIIDSRSRPGSVVISQGSPNEKTTLFFYVHRKVFWVDGRPNMEFATRELGIGRDDYLTREQVAKMWRGSEQVFLVIEDYALADWKAYLGLGPDEAIPIGTCGSRVVLLNQSSAPSPQE
jgi:4-amino-4-deoxy-L-arabinose transferase-like glycosyltransferase